MKAFTYDGPNNKSTRYLYTPSQFAKDNLITLQELGQSQAKKIYTSHRENINSFLFFFVEKGKGTLQYKETTFELKQNDCVFIDCQYPYYHQSKEELWSIQWIHFTGKTIPAIYDKYIQRGGQPVFHLNTLNEIQLLWKSIQATLESDSYIKDMEINEQLSKLLTIAMQNSWQTTNKNTDSKKGYTLTQIKDYIDQNYKSKITLDNLAQKFYINKFYLTRIFKEQYGISISNYIIQLRITQAKQELRYTNKPIEEISQSCGLQDVNYFARLFKKTEGVSPSVYRKKW